MYISECKIREGYIIAAGSPVVFKISYVFSISINISVGNWGCRGHHLNKLVSSSPKNALLYPIRSMFMCFEDELKETAFSLYELLVHVLFIANYNCSNFGKEVLLKFQNKWNFLKCFINKGIKLEVKERNVDPLIMIYLPLLQPVIKSHISTGHEHFCLHLLP